MTEAEYFYHHPIDKTNQVLDTLIHSYGPNTTLQEAQDFYNKKKKLEELRKQIEQEENEKKD